MKIRLKATFLGGILLCISVAPVAAQAIWKQYNGPFAGEVSSFASYGDTLFAGSTLTGIFKSSDSGTSWTPAIPELTYVHSLHSLGSSLLIGSDRLLKYRNPEIALGQVGQQISGAISYILDLDDKFYVTTDYGVYQYHQASNKLILKGNGLPEFSGSLRWTRDLVNVGSTLFCNVISSGLYKSINQGDAWTRVNVNGYSLGFNFAASHGDSLFCGGDGIVFLSTDQGANWTDIEYDLPPNSMNKLVVFQDQIFLSTYKHGVYRLRNGETHWAKVSNKMMDVFHIHHDVLFTADKSGVYQWDPNSDKFMASNRGINTSRVNEIELFNQRIYSATERGVHFTVTDDDDWSIVPELEDIYTKSLAKKDTMLFAGTAEGVYSTSVNSTAWHKVDLLAVGIWDIEVANNKVYVASDDGLFVSHNDGKSWKLLANSASPHSQVLFIGVDDSILIAGNNTGLYKIHSDSSDWTAVNFFKDKGIFSINVIEGDIYASSMNSPIYRSSDNAETWSVVNIPVTSKVDMIKRGDNLYASDYNKIYYSSDNGSTWSYFYETGIPDILINSITEGDSAFYIGTYGKSIWHRPFLSLTNIDSDIYDVTDSVIYDLPANTSLEDFRSNVEVSYGTSLEVEQMGNANGRISTINFNLQENDKIKIIAEDGTTERTLRVSGESRVLAVGEIKQSGLTVFPNPVKDRLFLQTPQEIESCFILNSLGQKVADAIVTPHYIDVGKLPGGFYLLGVLDRSNRKVVVKFIKE